MVTCFKGQVFQTPLGIRFNVNTTKYSGSGIAIPSKFERPFSSSLLDLYCTPFSFENETSHFQSQNKFCVYRCKPCLSLLRSGKLLVQYIWPPSSDSDFPHQFLPFEAVEVIELKN